MPIPELEIIKDIPGYKVILKAVIKNQIQELVDQLADSTGEESVILTASVSDGSLGQLGSESGKVFLQDNEQIKTQFLGFCLKRHAQSIQNVQQPEEHYPAVELRQGRKQNFTSEELQPLLNQQGPSYLNSVFPAVLVEQMPPEIPLQFDNSHFNLDSQFSINSVPLSHEHHKRPHGNSKRGRPRQPSGKRGRKKPRSSSTRLLPGQMVSSVNLPSETEPVSKVIKIEAQDNEMDSFVKSVVEKSQGVSQNHEERPVTTSHSSTLRSLLNCEVMPSNSANSILPFSHISNNTDGQSYSVGFGDGNNNNDIGVSTTVGDECGISDNTCNVNTTGNVLGLNCKTNTAKGGFRIVVHDRTEDVETDLKNDVKEEVVSESEMDVERSGHTSHSNNMVRGLNNSISRTEAPRKSETEGDDRKFTTGSGTAQDNDEVSITITQETQTPLTDLSNPPAFGHGMVLKGKRRRRPKNVNTSGSKSPERAISGQGYEILKSNWSRCMNSEKSVKDELPQVLAEEMEKLGPKHSRKGPQICEFCGLWCKSLAHYKIHFRVHSGLKPFTCQYCKKQFSRKTNHKLHELRHFSPINSKRHLWRVSDNATSGEESTSVPQMMPQQGTGPHQCNVCNLRCQSYALYKVHYRSHSGEKPYKCNFCEASFTKNYNRKVHEERH